MTLKVKNRIRTWSMAEGGKGEGNGPEAKLRPTIGRLRIILGQHEILANKKDSPRAC
jgi:hypothetical protein